MKRISGTLLAMLAVGACAASTAALADNPAGFYLGAGVGYSTIRSDDSRYGLPGYYNDHQTAWKVIVGIRPIPIVGAEFEYIDFGQPGNAQRLLTASTTTDSIRIPRAAALFGVGYLPLPMPFFDVYGKAGVARLQTDVTTFDQLSRAFAQLRAAGHFSRHGPNRQQVRVRRGRAVQSLGMSRSAPNTSASARSSAIRTR